MFRKFNSVMDAHVHVGSTSLIKNMLKINKINTFQKEYKVKHFLAFTFHDEAAKNNLLIHEASLKNKDIHPLWWIQDGRPNDVDYIKNLSNLSGCKFHGAYEKNAVSHKDYSAYLEILNKKRMLLLVHCGQFKNGERESKTSYLHVIDIARTYPNIKFILGHMGGSETNIVKNAVKDCRDIDNIYFESSGIKTPYSIEFAVENLHHERILFGSDFPWCSFNAMYWNVADAKISDEIKRSIFRDNFMKLIKQKVDNN